MSDTVTYLPPRIKRMVLIEKESQSAKSFFLNYIQGLEVKINKKRYIDSVFYFKNGCCLFEYNEKNGDLYCKYDGFWSVFEREYNMDHQQIQAFIKNGVEEHFKIKVTTLIRRFIIAIFMVEEHFKIKVTTPTVCSLPKRMGWKNILNLR